MFGFIQQIIHWFKGYFRIRDDLKVQHKDLIKQLQKQFPSTEYIDISDAILYPIYTSDMKKILSLNIARLRKYTTDRYDCEDFSYVLNGFMRMAYPKHTFGTCKVRFENGQLHRLCCFINEFGLFMFLEPQTNLIFKPQSVSNMTVLDILM